MENRTSRPLNHPPSPIVIPIRKLLTLLLLSCFAASCSFFKKEEKEEPEKPETTKEEKRLVGRIASIPKDRKFVLIQSYGVWTVETGSILISNGPEGRTANLRATGEKLGQFAAADIQSGTLEIGDGVYTSIRPTPTPTPTPSQESETTTTETTSAQPTPTEPTPDQNLPITNNQ